MSSIPTPRDRLRTALRWLLATIYLVAGFAHLAIPHLFLRITPGWVPFPETVIALTGLCEIAGAAALLTTRLRWWGGALLAVYAVCVYPANVKHAIDDVALHGKMLSLWYHVPRLLLQPAIVWWALFAGRVTDWPVGGSGNVGFEGDTR